MNNLLEQLKQKQEGLELSDYGFSKYLGVSKQLWHSFKSGKTIKSRKIEIAAREKFPTSFEVEQNRQRNPASVLIALWDRLFK